jgi:signal transduction histidine kinase
MVQTNLQFFNVQEFANEVIEEVQSTAKSGQEIVFESDIQYADIIADAHILKNIIINLLSNAIKYSPENSRIILKAKTSKYELVFKIKDSGIGIPQEDQKHLFERFFRAKNVLNIQGTGLGLNIVKKYLDLLNGNISFTSTEGKGTEFIVTVPIKI